MPGLNRRKRPPKRSEKERECRRCGHRTAHVYDHGYDRFICTKCELGNDNRGEGGDSEDAPIHHRPPNGSRRGL